jgi:DNA-binding transcriptional regulator WhiA
MGKVIMQEWQSTVDARQMTSALLRFTDALHVVQGRVVVQARVDAPETAHRVRRQIVEVFAVPADQVVLSPDRSDPPGRYLVQVVHGGDALARRAGLVDRQGHVAVVLIHCGVGGVSGGDS